jgi:GNAT superfamily N-acetyltransferase
MELRDPDADDGDRIHEVARSAMTSAYSLSPDQIRALADDRFDPDRIGRVVEADDRVAVVAADTTARDDADGERTVAGYAEAVIDDEGAGEIRWLFVDPEHRGRGIGTELFETVTERLRDQGVDDPRAATLQANQEGHQFFDAFGYDEVGERSVEIADQSLVEYVFENAATDEEKSDRTASEAETETETGGGSAAGQGDETDDGSWAVTEFPGAEERDGEIVATTDDGEEKYLDREEPQTGREAPFFPAYSDSQFEDRYGFYCGNCGSLDVQVDEMERSECSDCGNAHAAKDDHDASYL